MPRWLGDNRFEWPDETKGTSSVLFVVCDAFKFKLGKLWPKWTNGWMSNVFGVVPLYFVLGVYCNSFLDVNGTLDPWTAEVEHICILSSLDNELAFS